LAVAAKGTLAWVPGPIVPYLSATLMAVPFCGAKNAADHRGARSCHA
jgi:hypothetical protein